MERSQIREFISKNRRKLALLEALLATVIWSSSFVVVKFGLETLGPLTIAGLRYSLGAIVLAPFLFLKRGKRKPIPKNLWLHLIIIGISSYTIGNGALFWGLKYIPATTGSFLMGLIPLLVMVGGAIFLKEIPTRWQGLGVFVSLAGSVVFFSGGLQPGEPLGIAIVALGLIGFMTFSLLGRGIARERSLDTLVLTTLPLIIGGLITICIALVVEGIPQFTTRSLWVVLWLALVNTSLGYLLYNHALRELTALEMNMVMNLTPLFTAFISWIMLGERLGLWQGIGLVVMIVGVFLVQRGRKKANFDG
ncbi:MAG: EamA family transporter [Anaerolineales bacterium]|nr:EamA family transporter [Anaerolineales bacterium]